MHQEHISFGTIRYNATRGTFEARVDVEREGIVFRYPCLIAAPLDMDETVVRACLAAHALQQSDSRYRTSR